MIMIFACVSKVWKFSPRCSGWTTGLACNHLLPRAQYLTHFVSISIQQLVCHKRRASGRLPEPQFGGQKFLPGLAVEPALLLWLVRLAACWLEIFIPAGWLGLMQS